MNSLGYPPRAETISLAFWVSIASSAHLRLDLDFHPMVRPNLLSIAE